MAKAYKQYLEWAETHSAIFALLKYQLLHLIHQKNFYLSLQIELLLSQNIKSSIIGQLLRVTLNSKHRWKNHIENAKAKIIISLEAIAKFSRSMWGENFTTLKKLYGGVMIP